MSLLPTQVLRRTSPRCLLCRRKKLTFSERCSFGVVFTGVWAGTEVAVKHVKIRNAKCLQTVMETEVRIHSMVHQPNIVQIMAISYLKNPIYLVSELIKGRSLEELLFNDDETSNTFTIQSCNKLDVGKQVSSAVAYLHKLKLPLPHRDIKPANVRENPHHKAVRYGFEQIEVSTIPYTHD